MGECIVIRFLFPEEFTDVPVEHIDGSVQIVKWHVNTLKRQIA